MQTCMETGARFAGRLLRRDGRHLQKLREKRAPLVLPLQVVDQTILILSSPSAGFGYFRSMSFSARTIVSEITQLRNHLRSDGTTYQGACFVEVFSIASSNAFM